MLFRSISCPDVIQPTETTLPTGITHLYHIPYLANTYVRCMSPPTGPKGQGETTEDVEDEDHESPPPRVKHRFSPLSYISRWLWAVDSAVDDQQELPEYLRTALQAVAHVNSVVYDRGKTGAIASLRGRPILNTSSINYRSELDWEDREELEVLRTLGVPLPVHREGAMANVLAGCQRDHPGNILRVEDVQTKLIEEGEKLVGEIGGQ